MSEYTVNQFYSGHPEEGISKNVKYNNNYKTQKTPAED